MAHFHTTQEKPIFLKGFGIYVASNHASCDQCAFPDEEIHQGAQALLAAVPDDDSRHPLLCGVQVRSLLRPADRLQEVQGPQGYFREPLV